jgi:uncharacterized protein (TIGR02598 family)
VYVLSFEVDEAKIMINRFPVPNRNQAFSLVEVVIAVGIMALGIVAILGLLPHGLAMTKKTSDLTYQTRIFQQLLSEYQSLAWSTMQTNSAGGTVEKRYFDYQGVEILSGSNPRQELFISYVAEVEIDPLAVSLPSVTGNPPANDNLRRLIVRIAPTPNKDFDFAGAGPRSFATYSAHLAKMN